MHWRTTLCGLGIGLGTALTAMAESWLFAAPQLVSPRMAGVYHHLESAGRRNIAVSGDQVAVIWEDERDGHPAVYLARKGLSEPAFSAPERLSGAGEAFEPGLTTLGGGNFAAAWEEDGRVHLRVIGPHGNGPLHILPAAQAVQPGLLYHQGALLLVAAQRDGAHQRIYLHRFRLVGQALESAEQCPVDVAAPSADQLYPTLAQQQGQTVVAWEDRRPGHTIIMAAWNQPDEPCAFTPPQRVSLPPANAPRAPFGRGHGVARVALTHYGTEGVFAAWADKRDFQEGYDIYGAHWQAANGFGPNQPVQDAFGGVARQWHATVSGDAAGRLVAAWTDERDGDANVMFSVYQDAEWSEDNILPGAAGPGVQNHPSLTLDAAGNLHVVWLERDTVNGPTRLWYSVGQADD